ncbi:hypothetical protein BBK36DRAFT_1163373 [Trichoderma citrinoviride]|uniref:Uncharacterized protein n=1 Tax=Trichoderma citrinoviride TaxID=58853 RepID=A0A2T4AYA3_9HYPO|nr:hypothetical protein BBK36DRAFT_1163373 [Trichoderma citrinoviride]PTB62040.1 hypothetical protein BBK36DRAFT_1163373 [Trichoderma citrinoviride]
MAFAGKYFKLKRNDEPQEGQDVDLEDNASDTTKISSNADVFDKTAFLSLRDDADESASSFAHRLIERAKMSSNFWTWLRWGVVVGLQTIIILLLCLKQGGSTNLGNDLQGIGPGGQFVETGGDINGLYKTLSHTYTYLKPEEDKFIPNMTSNENRMEIRRNWDMLMPLGSGSVLIPDYKDHPLLGNPITDDPIRSGPLFEASWTHALHCLYYSVDSYHQLILNGPSEEDNPRHAAHCFEYLRNSILCNLDMTLEGSMSTPDDKERGQPHVCRNREEAISWIEARRMDDAQDIVGP